MATDNFEWNLSVTKLLVSLYEENEVLYNNFHPQYKDRNKRLEILVRIAEQITEVAGKVCLVADVRRKINTLRTQYLAEKLKIIKSKSGDSGDNIYTPKLYWFPMLQFLDISSDADMSKSNLDRAEESENSMPSQDSIEPDITITLDNYSPVNNKGKKRKMNTDNEDHDILQEATNTMRQMAQLARTKHSNSNIDTFGHFVSSELNCILENSNSSYVNRAKRDIQKVIFNIWDDIEQSRPSVSGTNYSDESGAIKKRLVPQFDTSIEPRSITANKVVSGRPCTIILKKKDLLKRPPLVSTENFFDSSVPLDSHSEKYTTPDEPSFNLI